MWMAGSPTATTIFSDLDSSDNSFNRDCQAFPDCSHSADSASSSNLFKNPGWSGGTSVASCGDYKEENYMDNRMLTQWS